MQRNDVDTLTLRARVEADFCNYAEHYRAPDREKTMGVPWSREKIASEVREALLLVVDPYHVFYNSSDDMLPLTERLIGRRSAFVVAKDEPYVLLFDHDAEDFVLAYRADHGELGAWGLRGDSVSTFLAR
jgi:hypothetical protein